MIRVKRPIPALLLFAAHLLFLSPTPLFARSPDSELGELAEQLMYGHSKEPHQKARSRAIQPYFVTDFETAHSKFDRLGLELADEFARVLLERSPEVTTVDRSKLGALLEQEHLGPQVLQVEEVALWFARLTGARSIVVGMISPRENGFDLAVRLVDIQGKELSRAKKFIEWSEERRELVKLPPREPPTLPSPRFTIPLGGSKMAGVPEPKCKSCPQPEYSDQARLAHIWGKVVLTILIGPDGSVHVMSVQRPLSHGLTAQSVDTARKWKFHAPVGPDGTPVYLDVGVEISFRLLF